MSSNCARSLSTSSSAQFKLLKSSPISEYLLANKEWASSTNPAVFKSNAAGQQPHTLWIGCADLRCLEHSISNLQPGEIFTHRNIANIVNNSKDPSAKAIISFAVNSLKVDKILVAGHTKCGGVDAALGAKSKEETGLPQALHDWLEPLVELRLAEKEKLDSIEDKVAKNVALLKLNVKNQVNYLVTQNQDVKKAIEERGLEVHGLIYNVDDGLLELVD